MHPVYVPQAPRSTQPQLLMVEDDPAVRSFCLRLLRLNGHIVTGAENGVQALEILGRQQVDLVLTDLHMPEMDGIALLQQIQAQYPGTDTIMITAFGTIDTAKRALKLGAFDFMIKPVNTEDLERAVRQCLEYRAVQVEKQRLTEMVTLLQLSQTITSTLDTDMQVRAICRLLVERFAPEVLALSLLDPDHDELVLLASQGLPASEGRIALSTAWSDEQLQERHYALVGTSPHADQRLEACLVLRTNDHRIGVLQLARATGQPAFGVDDRQLLTVFAAQVASALENGRLYQALKNQNVQIIRALAAAIDARDPYTRGHSEQVARYAVRMATALGMSSDEVEQVRYAALLHDVGKIGIRDAVLLKPGPLDDAEYRVMKEHPLIGAEILGGIRSLHELIPSITQHHERIDGRGYPHGIPGNEIDLVARILAVADSFDAMTSQRAYRSGLSVEHAIGELMRGRGNQWDAQLVDMFVAVLREEGDELTCAIDRPAQQTVEVSANC